MPEPTLAVLAGYLDLTRKSEDQTHIITLGGRRISVPNASIASKHRMEPGEDGAYRFFLSDDAIVTADVKVGDLIQTETHFSHDTAMRMRLGMRASSIASDGETHFSHDTA